MFRNTMSGFPQYPGSALINWNRMLVGSQGCAPSSSGWQTKDPEDRVSNQIDRMPFALLTTAEAAAH